LPRYVPVDLDQLPKETADTARKWLDHLEAEEAKPPPRAAIYRPFGPPARSKSKRRGKRGPRFEYDTDGSITAAAVAVAERGVDDKLVDFIARVYTELVDRIIKAPGDTWMKTHLGPLHKRLKRAARRAKAAQKPPTNKAGR
jgi:hypothetical protein